MLPSLLVLMFLCCDFCPICCLLVDCCHTGLCSVFVVMLYFLHIGKYSLDFVIVWHFFAYCCVFVQCWCKYCFCANPWRSCPLLLHPWNWCRCFLPRMWILVFVLFLELPGGRVEYCIHFFSCSIPLSSVAVVKFTLSSAVSC